MVPYRIIERPAFRIAGAQTYISGQDNAQFGRFWEVAQERGLLATLERITGFRPGAHTGATSLGVSRVDADPARRDFYYLIGVELPDSTDALDDVLGADKLEIVTVPAATWAVFDAHGPVPDAIVAAEIAAFGEWLPASGYVHAHAPEMEAYLTGKERCEFWLPVVKG